MMVLHDWYRMMHAFSMKKKSMNFVLNRRLDDNLLTGIIPDAFCGDSASNYIYLYVKSFHIVSFWLTICTENSIDDYSTMFFDSTRMFLVFR